MTEEGPTTCERCGGSLRRVLFPTGIIFKGSGFYKTDSRASGSGSSAQKPASTSEPAKKSDSSESGSAKPDVSPPSSTTTAPKGKDATP